MVGKPLAQQEGVQMSPNDAEQLIRSAKERFQAARERVATLQQQLGDVVLARERARDASQTERAQLNQAEQRALAALEQAMADLEAARRWFKSKEGQRAIDVLGQEARKAHEAALARLARALREAAQADQEAQGVIERFRDWLTVPGFSVTGTVRPVENWLVFLSPQFGDGWRSESLRRFVERWLHEVQLAGYPVE
jgi:hypothetical protein